MSYLDQVQDPRRRATAIVGVAGIHAAIALGLVAGLTVVGVAPPIDSWDPFTLTPEARPTPPPPAPVEKQDVRDSVVTATKPPLDTAIDKPIETIVVDKIIDERVVTVPGHTVEPTIGPPVAPTFTPRAARPSNSPLSWISTDDYPAAALRREEEGTAAYRLVVGTNGRVSACDIVRSTGNGQLDSATCKLILRRARFEPATDETGGNVMGSYTGTVRWEIPG